MLCFLFGRGCKLFIKVKFYVCVVDIIYCLGISVYELLVKVDCCVEVLFIVG